MNESSFFGISKHYDNFISEFKTNLDCDSLVEYYEKLVAAGATGPRNNRNIVSDEQVGLTNVLLVDELTLSISEVLNEWHSVVLGCVRDYYKKYDILNTRAFEFKYAKFQKTRPSQGYHMWHHDADPEDPYRKLVTLLYLNDEFEGGETEFLYQQCRITPEKGKFVIFPAGWTHTHRGNPPMGGNKYIMTGWVEEFPTNKIQFQDFGEESPPILQNS
tara:strand:- start:3 stop:653 length:651 start_codon:yes stop_codon:yes gene_type:complete